MFLPPKNCRSFDDVTLNVCSPCSLLVCVCAFVCVVQVAREPYSDRLWDTGKNTHVWRSLREQQRRATSSSPTGRVGKCACCNGLVRGCVRASQGCVCVAVCPCLVSMWEFPQQEDETFDSSRKESSLLLSLMWSVCFSLFSFTSLLFLFSLFLIYRSSGFPSSSSDLFLCSCLSALCANRRICVYMCVWALVPWPYDYSTLRWGNTSRLDHTVRHGTVTWTCVSYPCTMAPRRCFNSVAEVQTPAWQSHPLETNQPPGYRVGMSGLLLSCFCLLENRIYLALLKYVFDAGSQIKAPLQTIYGNCVIWKSSWTTIDVVCMCVYVSTCHDEWLYELSWSFRKLFTKKVWGAEREWKWSWKQND